MLSIKKYFNHKFLKISFSLIIILFSLNSVHAQSVDLDRYVEQDSALFSDQIPNFIRIEGLLQIPYQLMQGQSSKPGMGISYNRINISIPGSEQKNVTADGDIQSAYRIGLTYALHRKLDLFWGYQPLKKIGSTKPYLMNLGFSYNLFDRTAKSHLNLLFSYSEMKRHEDMYIKSFYIGGLYKAFGRRLDYTLNFGINRIHGQIFPNEHKSIRIKKIENNFVYQIGFIYHLTQMIHLQASYLKANYSVYMWGFLITSP